MHVCVVPSWYPASADDISGSFFREQAIQLGGAGPAVTVISPQLLSLRGLSIHEVVARRGCSYELDEGVHTFRDERLNFGGRLQCARIGIFLRSVDVLSDYSELEHRGVSVVHAHGLFPAGIAAVRVAKRLRCPLVVTEHSTAFVRRSYSASTLDRMARAAASADELIAVSSPFARLLGEILPQTVGRWRVVPNPVSNPFFQHPLRRRRSGARSFVAVGALEEKKGYPLMLTAFARACSQVGDLRLDIVGGGSQQASLQRFVDELGLRKCVRFRGPLSRVQTLEVVADSDVFISASLVETFGVAVAEALALGVPVIATRSGGPEDIVTGSDGWLGPARDVDFLTTSILSAARGERHFDAGELRSRCEKRFGPIAVTRRVIDVYERARFRTRARSDNS